MDAVKFIQERNRMCEIYTPKRCEGCPADSYGGEGIACITIDKIDADRLVPIVEKWSKENPRKTRQSVFLEQWPEAMRDRENMLSVCPQYLDRNIKCRRGSNDNCGDCRREFWMQEVK